MTRKKGVRKYNFQYGDIVYPPKPYIRYEGEIEGTSRTKRRRLYLYDIERDEHFEADLQNAIRGHIETPSRRKEYHQRYAIENSKKTLKYFVGDIIGPNKDILFLEELSPYVPRNGGKPFRRGRFYNLTLDVEFESYVCRAAEGIVTGGKKSKGEEKLRYIFQHLSINFETQKSFDDLVSPKGRKLLFDFYLPDYNILIEYDGIQHYKNTWNIPEEDWEYYCECDKIKNRYCQNSNINLVRIPYTDFDKMDTEYIKDILKNII